jgi:hypothetical protein
MDWIVLRGGGHCKYGGDSSATLILQTRKIDADTGNTEILDMHTEAVSGNGGFNVNDDSGDEYRLIVKQGGYTSGTLKAWLKSNA